MASTASKIARTDEEIMEVRDLARKLTDQAEARGGSASDNEAADAIYDFIQWLYGWDDRHPRDGYLEDVEEW